MTIVKGRGAHVFSQTRPSQGGAFPLHTQAPRNLSFRPLPPPTGTAPFRLDLKSVLADADYQAIVKAKKLTFHFNGDMGGIGYAVPQELVAKGMETDFGAATKPADTPAFLYITGDCVYFNGEVKEYYRQFYQPYEFYHAPIFAVPGNHDGENLPGDNSLEGFVRNFCAPAAVKMPESGDSHRTAMVQPNVYWTLLTPMANFVGLYSNVPEGGEIRSPQTEWLVNELKTLPKTVPLFVTLHRHDYQRLTKNQPGGAQVPYIVTGAGGYHNLHSIMKVNGKTMVPPVVFKDKQGDPVTLEKYCDDHHGFLRMEVTDKLVTGHYYTVPRPQEPYSKGNQLLDYFEFDWKKKRYVPNAL